MRARFVVMANGPLHRPKLPGIPGIETFKGHTFHTSRWDYDYTGGDSTGASTGSPTSASASSAPAPPRCSASRTWRERPSTCTSSSAPRRRSTCAATARPIRSGPPPWSRAGSRSAWSNFNIFTVRRLRRGGPGQRRLDRHHRASCIGVPRRATPARSAARSWPTRWSWPTSRRWSRSAPGRRDRRATRRPPRRSSPGTASSASGPASTTSTCRPSTGPTSRWSTPTAQGVEPHHRARRGRRRHRVRARLPHLRHRLRGRHRLHAPGRLRDHRHATGSRLTEKWADGVSHPARHARARLPQLLHPGHHPGRLHGQLPARARRAGPARRLHDRARPSRTASSEFEADRGGRGGLGGHDPRPQRRPASTFRESCTPGYYNNEGNPDARARQGGSSSEPRRNMRNCWPPGGRARSWPASRCASASRC